MIQKIISPISQKNRLYRTPKAPVDVLVVPCSGAFEVGSISARKNPFIHTTGNCDGFLQTTADNGRVGWILPTGLGRVMENPGPDLEFHSICAMAVSTSKKGEEIDDCECGHEFDGDCQYVYGFGVYNAGVESFTGPVRIRLLSEGIVVFERTIEITCPPGGDFPQDPNLAVSISSRIDRYEFIVGDEMHAGNPKVRKGHLNAAYLTFGCLNDLL
ncbi:MAG TPA: hypothetical protein VF681_01305 [Abditibacteriaceae bacterium]